MKCIIPDTSAVIIGAISKILKENDLDYPEIIVPEAVVCELEHQANANRSAGHKGLKELQKLVIKLKKIFIQKNSKELLLVLLNKLLNKS